MPRLRGIELAERLREARPDLRVVFLSGNCDGHRENMAARVPGAQFLQKPFAEEALLAALRDLLDTSARADEV
jgi:two-component system response regulator FixJ